MDGFKELVEAGLVAAPVVRWYLGQAVIPDVHSRIFDAVFSDSAAKELHGRVRKAANVKHLVGRIPGRKFRRWFRLESTRSDLAVRGSDAFVRLVDSLERQMKGRRGGDLTREQAEIVVVAAIDNFIQSLPPSEAIAAVRDQVLGAIADEGRSAVERHEELTGLSTGLAGQLTTHTTDVGDRLEAKLNERFDRLEGLFAGPSALDAGGRGLPGSVRQLTATLAGNKEAEQIVLLVRDADDPRKALADLTAVVPGWLKKSGGDVLRLAAELAHAYGAHRGSAELFLLASEKLPGRAYLCARAAAELRSVDDNDGAAQVVADAQAFGPDPALDALGAWIVDDVDGILAALPQAVALADPFLTSLRLGALEVGSNSNVVIEFAAAAIAEHPEISSYKVTLARALLERARVGGASREADISRALSTAMRGRDQIRSWGGDSAEAVRVACLAAMQMQDFELIVRLGSLPPRGEATPLEASNSSVRRSVVQAALQIDDDEAAHAAGAGGTVADFQSAFAEAESLAESGAGPAELDQALQAAWVLADDEEAQVLTVLAMSAHGVSLPDTGDLFVTHPDLEVLVQAQKLVVSGQPDEAVELLRSQERTELVGHMLVAALNADGATETAVAELRDDADRFDDPGRLVRAVEILAATGQLDAAGELALEALLRVGPDRSTQRSFLYSVAVQSAANREAWREMAVRARSWLAEAGTESSQARWALTVALNNETKREDAWAVVTEHPALVPTKPLYAQLWSMLAASFAPGPETCERILELVDEFDDPDLDQKAVTAFLLMGDELRGDVDPGVVARFQELLAKHAVPYGDDPAAPLAVLSGSPEEMIEQLRPTLEGQARVIREMSQRVRSGYPYGVLAAAVGAGYVGTMVHRAAGCHPAATADPAVHARELEAALASVGNDVSLDPSVAVVGWYIRDLWPRLRSAFTRVEVTAPAQRDAAESLARFQLPSDGRLYFADGQVRSRDSDEVVQARLIEHATWVDAQLSQTPGRDWPKLVHIGASEPFPEEFTSWLSALDQAVGLGLPLWSDDLGLRMLAHSEGVATFGTDTLLEVLRDQAVIDDSLFTAALRTLREEYVVDLPLDVEWMKLSSAAGGWAAGPAASQFARPATWADETAARKAWAELMQAAGRHDPKLVLGWLHAAALGLVEAWGRDIAVQALVEFATFAVAATEFNPEVLPGAGAVIRMVAAEAGVPDTAPPFMARLLEVLTDAVGPEVAAQILSLPDLEAPEKAALRDLLFPGATS